MNLLRYCGIRIDRFESATAAFLPLWSSVKRMALEDLYRVARAEELAIELNGELIILSKCSMADSYND